MVQLINLQPQQLADLIKEGIKAEIQQLKKDLLSKNANDEILTRDEVCELLSINASTLWSWQKQGKVKAFGITGSRRYYKRSQILENLTLLKK